MRILQGLLIIASIAATPATAEERITLPRLYLEGQVGGVALGDLESKPLTGTSIVNGSSVTYNNLKLNQTADPAMAYGGEIGIRNLLNTRFRLGFAWVGFTQKIKDISGAGGFTTTGGTYTLGAGSTPPNSALLAAGVHFDNRLNIYTANAYYDFRQVMWHRPFIGLGVGTADIEHSAKKNLTVSGTVGTQVNITRNIYAGVKLTAYWIKGPKDGMIDYKPLTAGTVMFTTGVHF